VRGHRLVILGEEHHQSEHRAFGARVLPLLQRAGITHLALETTDQAHLDQAVRSQTVTPATDGWFTPEPQRAPLLRAAIALHLPIVAFDMDEADHAWMEEHPDDSGQYRERRMAEHIIERILQKEPAARVLIWVGYGHAYKYRPPGLFKMMAAWLWELSGEEPVSCYQQTGGLPQRWVDLVIRHPEPAYHNGRPAWLRTPDCCVIQGRIVPPASSLVQLHLAQEGPAGTPIDQYLTDEDGAFELFAPKGAYLLRWWSADAHLIGERPLPLHARRCRLDLPLT
jgi:heme-binding uptake protein ChaN (Tiki superfamily)